MAFASRLAVFTTGAMLAAQEAFAQVNSPQGSGPILGAVNWVQGTLLGNVATAAAVIAVAVIGFMMLTGRMNWKHGLTVIVGCFILFGAATIVGGIQMAARTAG
ncbi:MAG: type VI secretion protein [Alphaproteobacteria bacterium]|nr:MAG: type VI secretion protein [Alphaproteobacteria bacterium]